MILIQIGLQFYNADQIIKIAPALVESAYSDPVQGSEIVFADRSRAYSYQEPYDLARLLTQDIRSVTMETYCKPKPKI